MAFPGPLRLTLIQRLIVTFSIIGVCLISALVYAVVGLNSMHRMAADIARHDLTAATATIALRDSILAQHRAEGRYRIFRQPEFKELYLRQAASFRQTLSMLQRQPGGVGLAEVQGAYASYTKLCDRMFAGGTVEDALVRRAVERVEIALEKVRAEQQKLLESKLAAAEEREARTAAWAVGLALVGIALSLLVAALLIYSFSTSIGKLQRATHRIAAGDFDHDPLIPPGDEVGALSQDFIRMAVRLKELEQLSLDASPLTRLPGNIAIERSINRRLREQSSFAMCYIDLDNFKSYNDRYGYIRASDILKKTGEVIHEAVKRQNDPDAFVGHIGGDDFVVIIDARHAKAACQEIIRDFDGMIPSYYSEEDRAAGAIEGLDRYGVKRVFPLLTISIAVLTCQPGRYATAAEIATAAAKVKDRVKETSGSNYIIVREEHSGET
ncbi:diguanylate cyclase [Geobacter sp. SVR]|uniref:GGDEF domain-containing protein n=1 Tax=Geobacter sp. SVR TaxID=2495594 RepID=UPI00143EF657|nr:sensor domain-containing diguanylate cyclase [Geobacter sp. SVR]BCS54315.1 GGDEF domain-containing protein [Geobacter sp. SVR]GCF85826.1 GGDEF domain-containing protein [Geobacter sp. SVR]